MNRDATVGAVVETYDADVGRPRACACPRSPPTSSPTASVPSRWCCSSCSATKDWSPRRRSGRTSARSSARVSSSRIVERWRNSRPGSAATARTRRRARARGDVGDLPERLGTGPRHGLHVLGARRHGAVGREARGALSLGWSIVGCAVGPGCFVCQRLGADAHDALAGRDDRHARCRSCSRSRSAWRARSASARNRSSSCSSTARCTIRSRGCRTGSCSSTG